MRIFPSITILLLFFSCRQHQKKNETRKIAAPDAVAVSKADTLPNGKRLLDTYDSAMAYYYKEIVGSDTLKNGNITCYGVDDSMRYFYLRVGDSLHLLNQASSYQSPWSLGTLEDEFDTFFMTRIDNGNSTPSSYQIFDKKTGQNLLGRNIEAISFSTYKDTLFMLYDNYSGNIGPDSVFLFNVKTKKRKGFKLPKYLPEYCDIQIDSMTKNTLKLSFEQYVGENFEKSMTYKR